jgi:hypothetical protein
MMLRIENIDIDDERPGLIVGQRNKKNDRVSEKIFVARLWLIPQPCASAHVAGIARLARPAMP